MHSEWYDVPQATQQAIAAARARGGRVVAVGTTTRAHARIAGPAAARPRGDTDIFITPGFASAWSIGCVTNFHLPTITLLMLVSAFAGLRAHHARCIAMRSTRATASSATATRCCSARSLNRCSNSNCSNDRRATRAAAA